MKKSLSDWGVIILGVLIIFFIVYMSVFLFLLGDKPEFTIYKEECEGSSISMNNNIFCQANCIYGQYTVLIKLQEGDKDFTTEEERVEMGIMCEEWCERKSPIKQKCEKVEVDSSEWIKDICMNNEPCGDYQVDRFKEDLTIDWLDKNCECDGCYYERENGVERTDCNVRGDKCSYICGDYFIEVRE